MKKSTQPLDTPLKQPVKRFNETFSAATVVEEYLRSKGVELIVEEPEITALDIIWGVSAIAKAIGRTERATYHMVESGALPAVRKIGGRWCASRAALAAMFEK